VKLLTISADIDQAPELCKFAVSQNITVSLGHHLANSRDLANCAEAGATALTHLGNGLPKVGDRHKNPLWAGLGNDDLVAMTITDGFHLPPEIIKGIIRIKGIGKTIPVSDAAPISGLEPGRYHTLGNDVMLDENGLLYNPETGYMVGSSKNLVQGINHLLSLNLVTIDDIVQMAVHNPLKLINKSGLKENLPKKLIFDEKANKVFPKSR
jgi:N-acetylglucosamine-6-phosphate deacetylase